MENVTIIVPVYNAEQYLKACLDSIVSQTYRNIEIFLIDDGSTDNSGIICDEYAMKDKRIRVFHNENKGVSYSRNLGISKATSKYLLFVDSDDVIEKEYVYDLVRPIEKKDYDLVVCNRVDIFLPENKKKEIVINQELLSGNFQNDYYLLIELLKAPYTKLYKKEIIDKYNIRFPIGVSSSEDQRFNFLYFEHVKKYTFINKCLYKYFRRDNNSLSQVITDKICKDIIETLLLEKNYFEKFKIKNKEIILSNEIILYLNLFVRENKSKYNSYKMYKKYAIKLKYVLGTWITPVNRKKYIILVCLKNNIILPLYIYYLLKMYFLYK